MKNSRTLSGSTILNKYGTPVTVTMSLARRRSECEVCGESIIKGMPRLTVAVPRRGGGVMAKNGGWFASVEFRMHPFCLMSDTVAVRLLENEGRLHHTQATYTCVACGEEGVWDWYHGDQRPHAAGSFSPICGDCQKSWTSGKIAHGYGMCGSCRWIFRSRDLSRVTEPSAYMDMTAGELVCRTCETNHDLSTHRTANRMRRTVHATIRELKQEFFRGRG